MNLDKYYIDFADHSPAMEGIFFDDSEEKIARKTREIDASDGKAKQTMYGSFGEVGYWKLTDKGIDAYIAGVSMVPKTFTTKIIPALNKMLLDLTRGIQYAESKFDDYCSACDNKDSVRINEIIADFRDIFIDFINYNRNMNSGDNKDFNGNSIKLDEKGKAKLKQILVQFKSIQNKIVDSYNKKLISTYSSKSLLKKAFSRKHSAKATGEKTWMFNECVLYTQDFIHYLNELNR